MSFAVVDLPPPDSPTSAMQPADGIVELEPVDHRLLAVREHDAVELEMAVDPPELACAGPVGDVLLGVEDGRDLPHRRARRLHLAVELGELLQRLEDERQHADRGDQRADLERAAVDHLRAGVEHRDLRDHAEQLDRREEDRRELLRVGVRDAVRLVQLLELALEGPLAVERLHDRHAGDRLGELRGDGGDPRADVRERRVRRRWNQRVTRIPGGSTRRATRPSRQSSRNSPPIAATSVSVLTTSVVRPWLRTSESASTSLVSRAMIQPAFCCEK